MMETIYFGSHTGIIPKKNTLFPTCQGSACKTEDITALMIFFSYLFSARFITTHFIRLYSPQEKYNARADENALLPCSLLCHQKHSQTRHGTVSCCTVLLTKYRFYRNRTVCLVTAGD
jgi:hypothetical protein